MNHPSLYSTRRGVLLAILVWGVPPGSSNPDPISNQKCHFPRSFSDNISKIHTCFQTWPNLGCTRLSDSGGNSQVPSRFCFVVFLFRVRAFSIQRIQLSRTIRLGLIRQKLCHHNSIRMHFEFAYFYFVLIHLELKR